MKHATHKVIQLLKQRGCRITKARMGVVAVLAKAHHPLSIQELVAEVKADEASVYRTMALLVDEGLAEEIKLSGAGSKYYLAHEHHHHAVCTNCNKVVHVLDDQEPRPPKSIPGFSEISGHELTYFGLCRNCA